MIISFSSLDNHEQNILDKNFHHAEKQTIQVWWKTRGTRHQNCRFDSMAQNAPISPERWCVLLVCFIIVQPVQKSYRSTKEEKLRSKVVQFGLRIAE